MHATFFSQIWETNFLEPYLYVFYLKILILINPQCLKIQPKMSYCSFSILAFSTDFCPIKIDLSSNTVQKLAKLTNFCTFSEGHFQLCTMPIIEKKKKSDNSWDLIGIYCENCPNGSYMQWQQQHFNFYATATSPIEVSDSIGYLCCLLFQKPNFKLENCPVSMTFLRLKAKFHFATTAMAQIICLLDTELDKWLPPQKCHHASSPSLSSNNL